MKIYVFGSNGMLGRYVSTYLENIGNDVVRLTRQDYDLSRLTYESLGQFLWDDLKISWGSVIINCAGIINQRGIFKPSDYHKINSYFPQYLSQQVNTQKTNVLGDNGVQVIHASTDCVFSGLQGKYKENDIPDTSDLYGLTKAAGESNDILNIRCSILGEELENKVSFLEFVRRNVGGKIWGFSNQIWNGITCLQWAKNVNRIINNPQKYQMPIIHFFTKPISKFELASIINDEYNLKIEIASTKADKSFDKSLSTIYIKEHHSMYMPHLWEQINEMKEFKLR